MYRGMWDRPSNRYDYGIPRIVRTLVIQSPILVRYQIDSSRCALCACRSVHTICTVCTSMVDIGGIARRESGSRIGSYQSYGSSDHAGVGSSKALVSS